MSRWVRLWVDMPTDPKWRVIAKRAGRPISETLAVFMFMMANAGERHETQCNAEERGVLVNWSDEDVAAALDLETGHVTAIREAMQGKTLDGDKLTGWEKRQPKREDSSTERVRAFRKRNETQGNAPDSDSEEIREDLVTTPSTELVPAREVKKLTSDLGRGLGAERLGEVPASDKIRVCKALNIADAEPLVLVFDEWRKRTGIKPRSDIGQWFFDSAQTLWQNNPKLHKACKPIVAQPPEPIPLARPSSSLLSSQIVMRGPYA